MSGESNVLSVIQGLKIKKYSKMNYITNKIISPIIVIYLLLSIFIYLPLLFIDVIFNILSENISSWLMEGWILNSFILGISFFFSKYRALGEHEIKSLYEKMIDANLLKEKEELKGFVKLQGFLLYDQKTKVKMAMSEQGIKS